MAKIYFDSDADVSILEGKVIGIIGYGNQGRAQALNMNDSGIQGIIVSTGKDESWEQAKEDGFTPVEMPELVKRADIVFMLVPDEIMPKVYEDHVLPGLAPGMVLNFASGYNITFKQIVPPEFVDVVMVAPRMIGHGVRNLFLEKKGYPAFLAVEQDASGSAKEIALGLARAMGATLKGTIEVSFKDETVMDLLTEQAIWPMIMAVIAEAFSFEVEKGHPPEASLVELYMSKEPAYVFDQMAETGLFKQMPLHSHTSQYGQFSRLEGLDRSFIRETIRKAYDCIERGDFAKEWKSEQEKGMPEFKRLWKDALDSEINKSEEQMKKAMN